MDTVSFSMDGEPRGQGRPRATVIKGHASIYKDGKSRAYEQSIARLAAIQMRGHAPLEGPLSAALRFRLPIPKSTTKRQRARLLAGEEAYLGAYDLDNLAKSILDGMNRIVFVDDKQIVRLWAEKIASEQPGVDVRIIALTPQPDPRRATSRLAGPPISTLPQIVSTPVRAEASSSGDAGHGPL